MSGGQDFLSVIKTGMRWHQARQKVLAENVANADTVGYVGRDLKVPDFGRMMTARAPAPLQTATTDVHHLVGGDRTGQRAGDRFEVEKVTGFETTPDGNSVVLEEQMMKVTANQLDYQAATALYAKGLGLLKTAIGRRG